jgi:hypothetical protein
MRPKIFVSLCATVAVAVLAPPASASLAGFQTENGKVGCYLDGQGVRCDVKKPRWEPPPQPASCEFDWGQGLILFRQGPAEYVCASDTALDPRHDVLAAGEKVKRGRFKCKAFDRGTIKCVNKRNGEGFTVSRAEAELISRR